MIDGSRVRGYRICGWRVSRRWVCRRRLGRWRIGWRAHRNCGWRTGVFVGDCSVPVALAFVTGAALNLTLQRYIPWLAQRFPGIDVYAVINAFLWGLAIPLLELAVLRPLLRLTTARAAPSKPRSRVEQIDCIDPVRFVL